MFKIIKKNLKKIIILVIIIMLLSWGGCNKTIVYAWFSNIQSLIITHKIGYVNHRVNDKTVIPPYVLPGDTIVKSYDITNVGNVPCIVRTKIEYLWQTPSGDVVELEPNLIKPIYESHIFTNWWVDSDGWAYYDKKLYMNKTTPLMGVSIHIDKTINNQSKYANGGLIANIRTQSIQCNMDALKDDWCITPESHRMLYNILKKQCE